MASERTAKSVYAQRQRAIAKAIEELQIVLAAHAERAAASPGDWGFPGDLAAIEHRLLESVRQLGNREG